MKHNLDRRLWKLDTPLCGVDEAGRGALAGPVVAAAVIMPARCEIPKVNDSKQLSPARRAKLNRTIRLQALAWAIGTAGPRTIDRHNIRNAAFQAMRRAVLRLRVRPGLVLCDGWQIPGLDLPCTGITRGDQLSHSIACASILAKVHRDRLMTGLDRRYPGYGLAEHKGYPTRTHVRALARLGPSPVHRLTFGPVARCQAGAS